MALGALHEMRLTKVDRLPKAERKSFEQAAWSYRDDLTWVD